MKAQETITLTSFYYKYEGYLDELRTQRVGRTSAWVKLGYESRQPGNRCVSPK